MKRLLLPLLILVAFSAPALRGDTEETPLTTLRSIDPDSLSVAGGEIVVLKGHNLVPECPILCPPSRLYFGDEPAAILGATEDTIVARVPAHAAGRVRVDYIPYGSNNATLPGGAEYVPEEVAGRETILFPVHYQGAAGAGSFWETDFKALNRNVVEVSGLREIYNFPCQVTCPVLLLPLPANDVVDVIPGPPNYGRRGTLFYPDRDMADRVHFELRIRDTTNASDAGVEIPIVRDQDFKRGSVNLVDIPARNRFRQTLRIYDPDGQNTSVRIRILPMHSGDILHEEVIALVQTPVTDAIAAPAEPSYAEIPLHVRYPDLAALDSYRIEITPIEEDTTRLWAFVSVTHNETQHVTLVTPD